MCPLCQRDLKTDLPAPKNIVNLGNDEIEICQECADLLESMKTSEETFKELQRKRAIEERRKKVKEE